LWFMFCLGSGKERERKIALRALGFFLFVLFSAMHATGGGVFAELWQLSVKILALLFIGISFYIEPVQLPPPALGGVLSDVEGPPRPWLSLGEIF